MQSLHLNPRSSYTSTFPSIMMNSPGYLSRLNFIQLNLKVCFLINKCNLDLILLRSPQPSYVLEFFLMLTNLGSVTRDLPKQKPRPSLLMSLFLYEQSLNRICLRSYFFSQITSHSLKRVAQHSPLKRLTFLRKLYLQSHSKVICPCQNNLNSSLDILMTQTSVLASNQQLGLAVKF